MDLWTWLPVLLGLGIVTMGVVFAFALACEKV
jgi:hypothetical protein